MEKRSNPYTLIFGKEPNQLVSRYPEIQEVIDAFESEPSSQQVFMLTGIRGSGKTVMMTTIAKHFRDEADWYVIDLSPDLDLLDSFAAELGEIPELNRLFRMEKLSINLPGLLIDIAGHTGVTDAKVAVTRMLQIVKSHHKKVLITVDEAVNNDSVRKFASVFQILLRQELPVYLLMTGLYENIYALQNEKSLTFLYRAPKIEMRPLDLVRVAENYKDNLLVSEETARKMARMTKGYPFAFQVLGYLTWKQKGDYNHVIQEFQSYLEAYVYEKLLMEMSPKDRKVALGIAKSENGEIAEIKKILNISQNEWNPYRKRLLAKGVIYTPERGRVDFSLPFFGEYLLQYFES